MKLIRVSFFLRLLMEARGQTTMMGGLAALAFIGITGVAIDLGHGQSRYEVRYSGVLTAAATNCGGRRTKGSSASAVRSDQAPTPIR